jgi:hypothetical protein
MRSLWFRVLARNASQSLGEFYLKYMYGVV